MLMQKLFRKNLIQHLWETYKNSSAQIKKIEASLKQKGISKLALDHFAIIDLPGPNTGISHLKQFFSAIGYVEQGKDYLAAKQNDFLWMTEKESADLPALDVLPQVVVADFRLDALPSEVKKIIEKYAKLAPSSPQPEFQLLIDRMIAGDQVASASLFSLLSQYLAGRDWPLPTLKEFNTVHEFNELLAWVLIFGRKPNHFTLSVHLLDHFENLNDFIQFITDEVKLKLNKEGGIIKGGQTIGIAQGSTVGLHQTVTLLDGNVEIPTGFVEFVWRYPLVSQCLSKQKPMLWRDYFTGFVAQHANHVIESLYVQN
jgi:hypothetical protein